MSVGLGLVLQPELAYLELLGGVLDGADYWEVAPETLWQLHDGRLVANGFHRRFVARRDRPFVAHGTQFSVGTSDDARQPQWLARMREDQALFGFRWWTDHLGATRIDGHNLGLPLPLPMTDASVRTVRSALKSMRTVVPDVGVETTCHYFLYGEPLDEPAFVNAVVDDDWLLLDLHNVFTMAVNSTRSAGWKPATGGGGFSARDYVDRLDLTRVIEIHVSGGAESDPSWLPSGRTLRLDGHDSAVPEEVWELLAYVLPRCPNLRGVTWERMEGTVAEADLPLVREEIARLRRILS